MMKIKKIMVFGLAGMILINSSFAAETTNYTVCPIWDPDIKSEDQRKCPQDQPRPNHADAEPEPDQPV